jgi:hypothetical protein
MSHNNGTVLRDAVGLPNVEQDWEALEVDLEVDLE